MTETSPNPATTPTIEATHPPIVFVGGTGRSGTHVVARLLGRNSKLENISNEVRFHVEKGGYPDLLAGRTTPRRFVRRLRTRWWRGLALHRMSVRGLHRFVDRDELDAACERFLERYEAEPEDACRRLFLELLLPIAERAGKPGLIEQSCDTVREAPTLLRLFPDARFVHVVRDGRDAAASRVRQARGLSFPRTLEQGLRWWERRMRELDAGKRRIPSDQFMAVSMDELVELRRRRTYRRLRAFLGLRQEPTMRGFFRRQVSGGHGNTERWRRGVSPKRQAAVNEAYDRILAGFERDQVTGYRMLLRVRGTRGEDG